MGEYAQAARLAAHPIVESLLHGEPLDAGHRCEARVTAHCAGCGREWVFCTASFGQMRRIMARTWRCLPCESEAAS